MSFITQETWDAEYSTGGWSFLDESSIEKGRHAIIGMYCRQLFPKGKILDVGCGECVLTDFLHPHHQYLGLDLSEAAIQLARTKRKVNAQVMDAALFETTEKFDIIVFNEVIYYLDYRWIFEKYARFLNDTGVVIISVFRTKSLFGRFGNKIWRTANQLFSPYEHFKLEGTTEGHTFVWDVEIMKKKN